MGTAPGGTAPGATGDLYWADDACHTEKDDKPNDFEGAFFAPSHEFAVSCCSMDGKSCKSPSSCPDSASYDWADASCQGEGMRLCTKAELESGICCNGGCGFDNKQVWASSKPTKSEMNAPQAVTRQGELQIPNEEE